MSETNRENKTKWEWDEEACERILAEMRSQIGNYGWIWSVLRVRARQTGYPPRQLVPFFLKFTRKDKPLFVGDAGNGVRFLGRCDDRYSVDHAIMGEHSDAAHIAAQMIAHLKTQTEARTTHGVFLDVGANVGIVAAKVAKAFPRLGVFAFEPGEETSRRAAATFALNGAKNATLFPVAVGDTDGELVFYTAAGHSDFATANPADFSHDDPNRPQITLDWRESRVPCLRLDSILDTLYPVALIKIDVEGHEMKVLAGAKALILRDRPDIFFEWNPDIAPKLGWTPGDAADLLNSVAPYRCFTLDENGERGAFPPPPDTKTLVNVLAIAEG